MVNDGWFVGTSQAHCFCFKNSEDVDRIFDSKEHMCFFGERTYLVHEKDKMLEQNGQTFGLEMDHDQQDSHFLQDANQHRNSIELPATTNNFVEHSKLGLTQQQIAQLENVNRCDVWGRTPLHMAASIGDLKFAELLLTMGADPSPVDECGFHPLALAVQIGSVPIVRLLIKHGCDVNKPFTDRSVDRSYTCLHCAVEYNLPQMVLALVESGADVESRDSYGQTCLQLAARHGFTEVAHTLLAHGAEVGARDPNGQTALLLAVGAAHHEAYELLLEWGADPSDRGPGGASLLHLAVRHPGLGIARSLIERGADLDASTGFGVTALHVALVERNWPALQLLLERGADPNRPDFRGRTPLHCAVEARKHEAFEALLRAGADVNAADLQLRRPLHLAVRQACLATLELLLGRGAEADARDRRGRTALHLAVLGGAPHLLGPLLQRGADLDALDAEGNSPLQLAALSEPAGRRLRLEATCFGQLLLRGADPRRTGRPGGESPLHLAVARGACHFARGLLLRGATVHAVDTALGLSPLHLAVQMAEPRCIELLLDHGADAGALDLGGLTPLRMAAASGELLAPFRESRARLVAAGLSPGPATRDLLLDPGYLRLCELELDRLAEARLAEGPESLRDLLGASPRRLARLAKAPEALAAFSRGLSLEFPLYANMLEARLVRGQLLLPVLEPATLALGQLFPGLPSLVLDTILGFLEPADMSKLL